MNDVLHWLDEWVQSSGFGGAAAVAAAGLAYLVASKNRRGEDARSRELRWWEQARWAAERVTSEDQSLQRLAIAAMEQLVDEADETEAAQFAMVVLDLILRPDNVEVLEEDNLEGLEEREEPGAD